MLSILFKDMGTGQSYGNKKGPQPTQTEYIYNCISTIYEKKYEGDTQGQHGNPVWEQ